MSVLGQLLSWRPLLANGQVAQRATLGADWPERPEIAAKAAAGNARDKIKILP